MDSYKNHVSSVVEDVEDPRTGQIKKRYVNKSRSIGFTPQRIGHGHAPGQVPSGPAKGVKDKMAKADPAIMAKLNQVRVPRSPGESA